MIPYLKLIILGEGYNVSEKIKLLVEDLGISERVMFLGHIPRLHVYSLLYSFDVFVFPSLFEGLPEAAAQAIGAGIPSVLSDIV